jgi:hypothetical protein
MHLEFDPLHQHPAPPVELPPIRRAHPKLLALLDRTGVMSSPPLAAAVHAVIKLDASLPEVGEGLSREWLNKLQQMTVRVLAESKRPIDININCSRSSFHLPPIDRSLPYIPPLPKKRL